MVDHNGKFPLYAAALAGHQDIVKILMAGSADKEDQYPSSLHLVKSPDVLAILLQVRSTNVEALKDGETPLTAALSWGYSEVPRCPSVPLRTYEILGPYANPVYKQDLKGPTLSCSNVFIVQCQIKNCHASTGMQAAYTLLAFGASLTAPDEKGNLPLLHAVESHDADMVKSLLRIGGARDQYVLHTPGVCCERGAVILIYLHMRLHTTLATFSQGDVTWCTL